jgi:1-acyl-sn-glycerol-3-phosphate acyltransferase
VFKQDAQGYNLIIKRTLIFTLGMLSYFRFRYKFKLDIQGYDSLKDLPKENVLFVSNHQTYFAEVILFYHILCSHKSKRKKLLGFPSYLLNPITNFYYVAALETMKAGILPKLFAYTGSVSIKRTWRESGQNINRQVDMKDISNIKKALNHGWVLTFPQGTTKVHAPGRRGVSHIIRTYQPLVVPIQVDGFRRSFDKKGLFIKKKGGTLRFIIKKPMEYNPDENPNVLLSNVMSAIGQEEALKKPEKK